MDVPYDGTPIGELRTNDDPPSCSIPARRAAGDRREDPPESPVDRSGWYP